MFRLKVTHYPTNEPPVNPLDRWAVANLPSMPNWWLDPAYSNWANMPMTNKQCDTGNTNSRGRNLPISEALWKFIAKINNADGLRFCESVGRMIINRPYMRNGVYHDVDAGEPQADPANADPQAMAEPVIYPVNIYRIIYETPTHYRIDALPVDTDWNGLDPAEYNWANKPWLFPKCSAETRNRVVQNVMAGVDAFWVTLCHSTGAWIPKGELVLAPPASNYVINGKRGIGYRVRGADWYIGLEDGTQERVRRVTKSGMAEFYGWHLNARSVVPPAWF